MGAEGLRLYDTLTRRVAPFVPVEAGHARIYVCGVTVYDLAHVGHARVFVLFDVLVRLLEALGLRVTYVRNLTDVDDKIIDRARAAGVTAAELGNRMCEAFIADAAALGCRPPDVEPRATGHISEMLALIDALEKKGVAYRVDGDVYFHVPAFAPYGKLSGRKLEDLVAGARVEVDERKRNPADFALWKGVKPGEPEWPSEYGPGRPGWHIECSAMSVRYLGTSFDLHGGGEDLVFPHHENELAQSEAATGETFAHRWMHVSFLKRGAEKMSKSLGNFITIRDALERHPVDAVRLFLLQTHYRTPMEFSEEGIEEARGGLTRMYETLARAGIRGVGVATGAVARGILAAGSDTTPGEPARLRAEFRESLEDDLNTPRAVAALHDTVRAINRALDSGDTAAARALALALREMGAVFGILQGDPEATLEGWRGERAAAAGLSSAQVEALIDERLAAKKAKDFARADAIRAQLVEAGIDLQDRPGGRTEWSLRR